MQDLEMAPPVKIQRELRGLSNGAPPQAINGPKRLPGEIYTSENEIDVTVSRPGPIRRPIGTHTPEMAAPAVARAGVYKHYRGSRGVRPKTSDARWLIGLGPGSPLSRDGDFGPPYRMKLLR